MDLVPSPHRPPPIFCTTHQLYKPDQLSSPGWTSYGAQHHIRSLATDPRTGWLWLATWGGVLCWDPRLSLCTRHTSMHGLIGNSTRYVVVDQRGVIWAACQEGGLCSLSPDGRPPWQPHHDFLHCTVLCLIARSQEGVYVALRDAEGRYTLGEVDSPEGHLRPLLRDSLACRNIKTFAVDNNNTLWIGNALGLHCYQDNEKVESFDLKGAQVHALEADSDGCLWVGTNHGLMRFEVTPQPCYSQETGWLLGEVLSLTIEPDTGTVWAATAQEAGCIIEGKWRPVPNHPPGPLSKLLATLSDTGTRIWVGGAIGLYEVAPDRYIPALDPDAEDCLSNAVHSLWSNEKGIWMGTERGLYYFDDQIWHNYNDISDLCGVRSIVQGEKLWVGTWRGWLGRIEQDVYIPVQAVDGPIITLAADKDGAYWAATPDAVYYLPSGSEKWQPVTPPARQYIGKGVIQALCYQLAEGFNGELVATLWVGTSSGLFRYRSELGLWDRVQGKMEQLSIQGLALDPLTNHLWVGTSDGLFSDHSWQCHHRVDIRALAFSPRPEGTLWLGTDKGLEQWLPPDQGDIFTREPIQHFTATNSGLAANIITALTIRDSSEGRELWIGSPTGVSRYCYQDSCP